ncbi:exported hypothetical protein [Syntrophobacter sp. SbD1]|nr:exported hypothetical protein [Syntrophobacter sp. SbD1]
MRSLKSALIMAVLVIAWAILPATPVQAVCNPATCGNCVNGACVVSTGTCTSSGSVLINGTTYTSPLFTSGNTYGACLDNSYPYSCYASKTCTSPGCSTLPRGATPVLVAHPVNLLYTYLTNTLGYKALDFSATALGDFNAATIIDGYTTVTVDNTVTGSANLAVMNSLAFSAGAILNMGSNSLLNFGTMAGGPGTIQAEVFNGGYVGLFQGSSPIALNITGDFSNFITYPDDGVTGPGTVIAELGGASAGSYSSLNVTGTAYLGYKSRDPITGLDNINNSSYLSVLLGPDFFPSTGDEFKIIHATNGIPNQLLSPYQCQDATCLNAPQCLWDLNYTSNSSDGSGDVWLTNGRCADAGEQNLSLSQTSVTGYTILGAVHSYVAGLTYSWYEGNTDGSLKPLVQGQTVSPNKDNGNIGDCPLDISPLAQITGVHNLILQVTDTVTGNTATADMFLTIVELPIANAGQNQTKHEGNLVTLDGSGSSDPLNFVPLTYAWSFVSVPTGSTATLSDPTAVHPTFTADLTGNYVLQLVVTNTVSLTSTPSTVTISTYNSAPVADPGPDQTGVNGVIQVGSIVQRYGSKSYDPDGDPITYTWTFTSKPAASQTTLAGATTSEPTFVADVDGTYIIQLVVTDSWGASSVPKSVTVSFNNIKPVAIAGASQTGVVGDPITLNGGGSYDANLLPLTYQWSIASLPPWSKAVISNPTAVQAGFVPDQPGIYIVQLVVKDGFLTSDASTAQIKVVSELTYIHGLLKDLVTLIGSLDCKAFKNCSMRNELICMLHDVTTDVEFQCGGDALNDLNHILGRVDGCTASGAPDRDDWIIDCQSQEMVYQQLTAIIAEVNEELRGGVMRR